MWQNIFPRLIVFALVFSVINSSPVERQPVCSDDSIYCTALSLLDKFFEKESKTVSEFKWKLKFSITKKIFFQIENNFQARSNGYVAHETNNVIQKIQNFVKSRDFTIDLPSEDAQVVVSARKLDTDEVDFKLKLKSSGVESRKSKLKKVFIPIMIFVLLKAITLIPMALGVLGLKAWNSLQLSFFSFMISTGLAIFQLCKKVSSWNWGFKMNFQLILNILTVGFR